MQGTVKAINLERKLVLIDTGNDCFSLFILLPETEFNVGDEISWPNENKSKIVNITNDTTGKTFSAQLDQNGTHLNVGMSLLSH